MGGFILPNLLGTLKQFTGTFSGGFLAFAAVAFGCAGALVYVSQAWQSAFLGRGGLAANLTPVPVPLEPDHN